MFVLKNVETGEYLKEVQTKKSVDFDGLVERTIIETSASYTSDITKALKHSQQGVDEVLESHNFKSAFEIVALSYLVYNTTRESYVREFKSLGQNVTNISFTDSQKDAFYFTKYNALLGFIEYLNSADGEVYEARILT